MKKNEQLRALHDGIADLRASEAGTKSMQLEGVFHAEPRMTAIELLEDDDKNRMLIADVYTVRADFHPPDPEIHSLCIAQMDSLDFLLTDTELLVQKVATSCMALESRISN